jgi:hypothetical protein
MRYLCLVSAGSCTTGSDTLYTIKFEIPVNRPKDEKFWAPVDFISAINDGVGFVQSSLLSIV